MRKVRPFAAVLVFACAAATAAPTRPRCGLAPTLDFIFRAIRSHPAVMLGEQHRRKEFHEFLQSLVRDARFLETVDDVVVEFGSGRYQQVMDRYIGGGDVDEKELERAWHDTTQIVVWDSPVYRDFFRSIRELNARRSRRKVRVLLGDPPIDWAAVRTATDYGKYADRDRYFVDVVQNEVLARHRRGLLIYGNEHVLRAGRNEPPAKHPGAGDLLAAERPGMAFSIFTVPPSRPLAGLSDCAPFALETSGEIGSRSFSEMMEPGVMVQRIVDGQPRWVPMTAENSPPLREKADAVLWLGSKTSEVMPPPEVMAERSYLVELHRRAKIMSDFYGFDLTADLPPLGK